MKNLIRPEAVVALAVFAIGGCAPAPGFDVLGDAPELEGVELGMTALALSQLRSWSGSDRNGYEELRPDSLVSFEFIFAPSGSLGQSEPPPSSTLVAARRFERRGARSVWEDAVREAIKEYGRPEVCLRVEYILADAYYAEWTTEPKLEVSYRIQRRVRVLGILEEPWMGWSIGRISRPIGDAFPTFEEECPRPAD